MQPAKRRRMDDATSTLAKPFRSPLTVAPNKNKPSPQKQVDPNSQELRRETPTQLSRIPQSFNSSPLDTTTPGSAICHNHRTLSSPTRLSTYRTSAHDDAYVRLQKQHSALHLQLKDLNASLDTATQALKITQSSKDHELEDLIVKWRVASQDAAEELFLMAKDRVDRMGGVGAWREKFMKPREEMRWHDSHDLDENNMTLEQLEQLKIVRDEARLEAQKYGLLQGNPVSDLDDNDDTFTLDMMLKQLDIDLAVIRFDPQEQRWLE